MTHAALASASKDALALRLLQLRNLAGLNQSEMADKVGTGQNRICDYELALHVPSLPTLARYGEALGMTVADILEGVL